MAPLSTSFPVLFTLVSISGFGSGVSKCWSYVGCYTPDKIIPFPPNTGRNILNTAWDDFL
ncbi:hypothetical protein E2C01_068896 [Portunus trituberculatus]|uniref:Uncharacterized protein n=1 Tax=Portunus trituberculatus TaxID=210409 RepID=A0A5B7HXS3_PORTR|nr:hypothetical protein [Portunus trituberculatus]